MEERELDIQVGKLTIGMLARNAKSVDGARLGEGEQPAVGPGVLEGASGGAAARQGSQRGSHWDRCWVAA